MKKTHDGYRLTYPIYDELHFLKFYTEEERKKMIKSIYPKTFSKKDDKIIITRTPKT